MQTAGIPPHCPEQQQAQPPPAQDDWIPLFRQHAQVSGFCVDRVGSHVGPQMSLHTVPTHVQIPSRHALPVKGA